VLRENTLDGRPPNVVAQVLQSVAQPRLAPCRVLGGHLQQQSHDLRCLLRPPCPTLLAAVVLRRHQLAVPAENGVRRRDRRHFLQRPPAKRLTQLRQAPDVPCPSVGADTFRAARATPRSQHAGTESRAPGALPTTSRSTPPGTAAAGAGAATSPSVLSSPSVPFGPSMRRAHVCKYGPSRSPSLGNPRPFSRSSFGTRRGAPQSLTIRPSTSMTLSARMLPATSMASASRVQSSMTVTHLICWPWPRCRTRSRTPRRGSVPSEVEAEDDSERLTVVAEDVALEAVPDAKIDARGPAPSCGHLVPGRCGCVDIRTSGIGQRARTSAL